MCRNKNKKNYTLDRESENSNLNEHVTELIILQLPISMKRLLDTIRMRNIRRDEVIQNTGEEIIIARIFSKSIGEYQ